MRIKGWRWWRVVGRIRTMNRKRSWLTAGGSVLCRVITVLSRKMGASTD